MKTKHIIAVLILTMGFCSASSAVGDNRGAQSMVLHGGRSGDVPFPHHRHHEALKGCNPCHDIFPKVPGSIEHLKGEGKLQRKEAMNQCRACHIEKARKDEKTGPTKCTGCHSIK